MKEHFIYVITKIEGSPSIWYASATRASGGFFLFLNNALKDYPR